MNLGLRAEGYCRSALTTGFICRGAVERDCGTFTTRLLNYRTPLAVRVGFEGRTGGRVNRRIGNLGENSVGCAQLTDFIEEPLFGLQLAIIGDVELIYLYIVLLTLFYSELRMK